MKNLNMKTFLFILLAFSGLVWFVFASASGFNIKNLFDFMRPIPNVITADLILVGFFTKWGWRWKWLQGWLVPFPDLNGTWHADDLPLPTATTNFTITATDASANTRTVTLSVAK